MGRIPEQTIHEVRDRVDIVDLVGRHVDLKRAGRNFKGLCPFHNEKSPSFNVNPDRQIFHCFGCGEGGDVFKFLMLNEGLSFPEAARQLAAECGIEVPESSRDDGGESERMRKALAVAQQVYRDSLASDEGAAARAYLEGRGLDASEQERFGIGFAPDRWDAVGSALGRERLAGEIGEKAGVLVRRRSGSGFYDLLRGRVVFPIHDARGRIMAFGGRTLSSDDSAKYINTPETPVFRKREALYGLPQALEPVRRAGRAVICEGYFDRIALARAGIGEALATCGTALTPDHARQLRRRTREVVLLFDGDAAGRKATWRALEVLLPEGLRVRAAALPGGADPDDVLASQGAEALRAAVDASQDAIELTMDWALAEGCSTPAQKADVVGRLASVVALVQDPVERGEYARRLAVATDSQPAAVESVIRGVLAGRDASRVAGDVLDDPKPRRESDGEERHLRRLASLLLQHSSLVSEGLRGDLEERLPAGSWASVVAVVCEAVLDGHVDEFGRADWTRIESRLDEESSARLREVAIEAEDFESDATPDRVLGDLLAWFDKRRQAAQMRETTRRFRESSADAGSLLAEKQRQLEARRAAHGIAPGTTRPNPEAAP
ncbi:MAG: DNA primase [Myxococcota bacterium]